VVNEYERWMTKSGNVAHLVDAAAPQYGQALCGVPIPAGSHYAHPMIPACQACQKKAAK
jgi:hypothetical protein